PALHVERQPFLGEPLQDLKISTPVSSTVWLHRGCEDVLPQLLRLVKSGSSPCWHRSDDAGSGPLRSGRRGPRSPPENPRPRLPIQSRTLRQKAARTAARTNRGLDQPANPKARNPSLNSNVGCLKVVDTFRFLELPIANRIRHIPTDAPQDHVTFKMTALELDHRAVPLGTSFQRSYPRPPPSKVCDRTRKSCGQQFIDHHSPQCNYT